MLTATASPARSGRRAQGRRIGGVEKGCQAGNPPIPHLDQVEHVGLADLPVLCAELAAPVHHGAGWIDDAAVLAKLKKRKGLEQLLDRRSLLGAGFGCGRRAIRRETPVLTK